MRTAGGGRFRWGPLVACRLPPDGRRPTYPPPTAWLRRRFEELGVIQFEDWVDTGDEYEQFALDELELRSA